MKKATRRELDQLRKDVNDLNVMVYAIAQAAGVVPIRVPEQKGSTRWVRQDSEEWKAECERRKQEIESLKAIAQVQPQYIYPHGPYPGETIWPWGNLF